MVMWAITITWCLSSICKLSYFWHLLLLVHPLCYYSDKSGDNQVSDTGSGEALVFIHSKYCDIFCTLFIF